MKIDFNKNVVPFPRLYSGVVRQQGRVALDSDLQETGNTFSTAELKETTRADSPAVLNFGERVLLAQLQKAELNSRQAPLNGLALSHGVGKPEEPRAFIEPVLVDSREDVRRHRECLGNLLAKLHAESPSPNREKIVNDIHSSLTDLSEAVERKISLLTKFKGGLEKLRNGSDSLLEKTISDIATEIRENLEQLRNTREWVQS